MKMGKAKHKNIYIYIRHENHAENKLQNTLNGQVEYRSGHKRKIDDSGKHIQRSSTKQNLKCIVHKGREKMEKDGKGSGG